MANSSKRFQVTQATQNTVQECADSLYNALNDQGIEVSKDRLFDDLSSLVTSHGNGEDRSAGVEASGSNPGTHSSGEVDTDDLSYMVSADLICMAYAHYQDGNTEKALRYAAVAFEENDAEDLFESLHEMNTLAESNEQLEDSNSSNTDTEDFSEESNDSSESGMDLDDDLENEINASEMDEDEDNDDDYNYEDDEEDEDEMDAESGSSTASIVEANKQNKTGTQSSEASSEEEPDREEIALANRVSISGSNNDRRRGRTLVRG